MQVPRCQKHLSRAGTEVGVGADSLRTARQIIVLPRIRGAPLLRTDQRAHGRHYRTPQRACDTWRHRGVALQKLLGVACAGSYAERGEGFIPVDEIARRGQDVDVVRSGT